MVGSQTNPDMQRPSGRSNSVTERLTDLGLTLPQAVRPSHLFVPALTVDGLVTTSGQVPVKNGVLLAQGMVGLDVDLATAQDCARQCVLNGLAAIREEAGDLERVAAVTKLLVFVATGPGFTEQSAVADAASGLLLELFGDSAVHVRSAIGVVALPRQAPVEIELAATIRP
ncbi:RidA family protein [Streptomyces sp. NPDC017964]|uniref:RidA family protein n=1 Tax=Streptomyces sp. NPDC017964 TaxID=3365022 RepID=UPI0037998064